MLKLKSLIISNEEIKNLYLSGISTNKIARIAQCSPHTINSRLIKFNIQKRTLSEANRKYQLKEI